MKGGKRKKMRKENESKTNKWKKKGTVEERDDKK